MRERGHALIQSLVSKVHVVRDAVSLDNFFIVKTLIFKRTSMTYRGERMAKLRNTEGMTIIAM